MEFLCKGMWFVCASWDRHVYISLTLMCWLMYNCLSFFTASGVPSLWFDGVSRSPPARSMLQKLSTQRSYQLEVSPAGSCCLWFPAVWHDSKWKLPTGSCCSSLELSHFLKSSEPGTLSYPCHFRSLKSWRPIGKAELLQTKPYRGVHWALAVLYNHLWFVTVGL